MKYNEEYGHATFAHGDPGAFDTCGNQLEVKCTLLEAENIARALQRAFRAGKTARSQELRHILEDRS